jgi:hypothetical protein
MKPLDAVLGAAPSIAQLVARAKQIEQLSKQLRDFLPLQILDQCTVVNFNRAKLVIHARNGPVAAKLRHIVPRLLAELQRRGWQVNQIGVVVQAWRETTAPHVLSHPPLGEDMRACIAAFAEELPAGSLRAAVEALAAGRPRLTGVGEIRAEGPHRPAAPRAS